MCGDRERRPGFIIWERTYGPGIAITETACAVQECVRGPAVSEERNVQPFTGLQSLTCCWPDEKGDTSLHHTHLFLVVILKTCLVSF